MNKLASAWDPTDLESLLTLDEVGPSRYRNRYHDPNHNTGRAYGGQVMGQALTAAAQSVPADRTLGTMQVLFLQGTRTDQPIDYVVTPLQDGRRFSSRHVRAYQGDTPSLDVHLTFQTKLDGPSHWTPPPQGIPGPEGLPKMWEMHPDQLDKIQQTEYSISGKPSIDLRMVLPESNQLGTGAPVNLHYWLRASRPLPPALRLQEAAMAYISDSWINFASAVPHIGSPEALRGLFIVSLNHNIWIHRLPDVHDWMLVVGVSPMAHQGRALNTAHFYDPAGNLLATAMQESLLVYST